MRVKSNKRTKLIAILVAFIMLISVGYAALTTNLNINGTAIVKAKSWNVHFTNIVPDTTNNNVTSVDTAPTLSNNNTVVTWEVSMDTPGQVYQFNVDVINEGTIDAMVSTETNDIISALTVDQRKYLDYTVTYVNGEQIEQYDKLAAGETKTLKVRLAYKSSNELNASDLPATDQAVSLSYEANYVQADSNAVTKVTALAEPLEIGETVNYSTTLNGQTLNNWKVFYVDGDYTYLILDYYLPTSCISDEMISTYDLYVGEYSVSVNDNRANLLNAMTTTSNWSELINNGSINGTELSTEVKSNANLWAMGAPTVDLWVNSWNAKHTSDILYIAQTESPMDDGLNGYYIGESENPTSGYVRLLGETEINDTLYFLDNNLEIGSNGYWYYYLASPSGLDMTELMYVQVGAVGYGWYDGHYGELPTFRPVIKLPTSVVNQ